MGTGSRRTLEKMGYKDLVEILDREFSLYVRLSAADERGYVQCVTCNTIVHWKEIAFGHFISRYWHSVRWDIKNGGPQCEKCNILERGKREEMRAHLVKLYGEDDITSIEVKSKRTKTESAETLRAKIRD